MIEMEWDKLKKLDKLNDRDGVGQRMRPDYGIEDLHSL